MPEVVGQLVDGVGIVPVADPDWTLSIVKANQPQPSYAGQGASGRDWFAIKGRLRGLAYRSITGRKTQLVWLACSTAAARLVRLPLSMLAAATLLANWALMMQWREGVR